jgi:hypothetical protein
LTAASACKKALAQNYAMLAQLPLQSLQVQESALFRLELITPQAAIAAFQFHLHSVCPSSPTSDYKRIIYLLPLLH